MSAICDSRTRSAWRSSSCASSSSAVRLSRSSAIAAHLHRAAVLHLGESGLEALDLGAQLVTLLGGGAEDCESLEHGAELLLEPVAPGCELVPLDGVPLLLLGETALLLGGCDLRLGEGGLEALELRRSVRVLLLQAGQVLFVARVRLGEGAAEALDLLAEAGVLGGRRPRLDQGGLDALDLDAELVTFVGRLPERRELFESGAELLLDPVALSGDRFALCRVPLLLPGKAQHMLGGCGLRLGERILDTLELRGGEVVLLL